MSIDIRSDSRIRRKPKDEIDQIRRLLHDIYKDEGDGRTIVRELVQNADDAEAKQLSFLILDEGRQGSENPLLRGAGLIIVNSGSFREEHQEGLHAAMGGSKQADQGKVGRFGLGMKSLFHLCEAFCYVGRASAMDQTRAGVLNPWAGTGAEPERDPKHPEWDQLSEVEAQWLADLAQKLLKNPDGYLFLWIPLRNASQLDRYEGEQTGLSSTLPDPQKVDEWFERVPTLTMLLGQCAHVAQIDVWRALNISNLTGSRRSVSWEGTKRISRYEKWPHKDDSEQLAHKDDSEQLDGRILERTTESEVSSRSYLMVGVEKFKDHPELKSILEKKAWPKDEVQEGKLLKRVSRKALPHAAVTVLSRGIGASSVIRWAVFFPLDDDPTPTSNLVYEIGVVPGVSGQEILLHGYFWPSQDRKSIPGVTDKDKAGEDNESGLRACWNRYLCEELLLPLLPMAMQRVVEGVESQVANSWLYMVYHAKLLGFQQERFIQDDWLLPILTQTSIQWRVQPKNTKFLKLQNWHGAPTLLQNLWWPELKSMMVVEGSFHVWGGTANTWPTELLQTLFNDALAKELKSVDILEWLTVALPSLLQGGEAEEKRNLVAEWLAGAIGQNILPDPRKLKGEDLLESRQRWVKFIEALGLSYVLPLPTGSREAVVALASAQKIGRGLLPIPIKEGWNDLSAPELDRTCLQAGLLFIGQQLLTLLPTQSRSWLLLVEAFLEQYGFAEAAADTALQSLPLIRIWSAKTGKDEAHTLSETQKQIIEHRILLRDLDEKTEEEEQPEEDSEPLLSTGLVALRSRKAAKALQKTIGGDVWLISSRLVRGHSLRVPEPTVTALANMLLQQKASLPSTMLDRQEFLAIIANESFKDAIRVLLHGLAQSGTETLYYLPKGQPEKWGDTAKLLLRLLGRSWVWVDSELAGSLAGNLLSSISVKAMSKEFLQQLAEEALNKPVPWHQLTSEESRLLRQQLYQMPWERWRALPLHPSQANGHVKITDKTVRVVDLEVPSELAEEVVVLQPEPDMLVFYQQVPLLNAEQVVRMALESSTPAKYAILIADQLLGTGQERGVLEHRFDGLKTVLKERSWLPSLKSNITGQVIGISPQNLLLPDALLKILWPDACNHIGQWRFPEEIEPNFWKRVEMMIRDLCNLSKQELVSKLAEEMDTPSLPAGWRIGRPNWLTEELLNWGTAALGSSHSGWKLLNQVKDLPDVDKDALLKLGRRLCGDLSNEDQRLLLTPIIQRIPKKDAEEGKLFVSYLSSLSKTKEFWIILHELQLPTQDGNWHRPEEIVLSSQGFARQYLLIDSVFEALGLRTHSVKSIAHPIEDKNMGYNSESRLRQYFEPWRGRVPNRVVGAFLALLGNGDELKRVTALAKEWLGKELDIYILRRALLDDLLDGRSLVEDNRIWIDSPKPSGTVLVQNLLGIARPVQTGDQSTIFLTDPRHNMSQSSDRWEIQLRIVPLETYNQAKLIDILGESVLQWVRLALPKASSVITGWWKRFGASSQMDIDPIRRMIISGLPHTLRLLDAHRGNSVIDGHLRKIEALEYQTALTRSGSIDIFKVMSDLSTQIENDQDLQKHLLERLRYKIDKFRYGQESVLPELLQNADDALAQRQELSKGDIDKTEVIVRLVGRTLEVKHWGRPINETGGEYGRSLSWDRDLLYMLQLNLSGKQVEQAGREEGTTTGHFGLGFKSVYLISDTPEVDSGFISFKIVAGLLPQEQGRPPGTTESGGLPTHIRLPLLDGILPSTLLHRFRIAAPFLPALARKIRSIKIETDSKQESWNFIGKPIKRGWEQSETPVRLPSGETVTLLRFCPTALGEPGAGTITLLIALKDEQPYQLPEEIPFLWNVLPTGEKWSRGYIVNGPFALDTGRTRVESEAPETRRTLEILGRRLGEGLCLLQNEGAYNTRFYSQLWKILVQGVKDKDPSRQKMMQWLHGSGHGVRAWMDACSVVPTELPSPFYPVLPPLKELHPLEASPTLADPKICEVLETIPDLATQMKGYPVVAGTMALILRDIVSCGNLTLNQILSEWLGSKHQIEPADFSKFAPLVEQWFMIEQEQWKLERKDRWQDQIKLKNEVGNFIEIQHLLLPPIAFAHTGTSKEREEEQLRVAFAPISRIANAEYFQNLQHVEFFLKLRGAYQANTQTLVGWFRDAENRCAALRYLVKGDSQALVESLRKDRPVWINSWKDIEQLVRAWTRIEQTDLRTLLFPEDPPCHTG